MIMHFSLCLIWIMHMFVMGHFQNIDGIISCGKGFVPTIDEFGVNYALEYRFCIKWIKCVLSLALTVLNNQI